MNASPSTETIAGVVFDLDGVLILSRDCHRLAFEEVLLDFGIRDFSYDEFAGWRTPEVFQAMFGRHPEAVETVTSDLIAQCSSRKTAKARQLIDADFPLAPACVATVRQLARRYQLALASSGSRPSVQAFLEHTALRPSFQSVLTGDDVHHAKPHPELFERSIHNLGLHPDRCLVIEDSAAGIQAARAAGARVIGVGSPSQAADLTAAGAENVIAAVRELPGLLNAAAL